MAEQYPLMVLLLLQNLAWVLAEQIMLLIHDGSHFTAVKIFY